MRPLLSVVVPCFNESEGLEELYRRVSKVCREQVGDCYEFVLVNDGSQDATWPSILALNESDPHVVGVTLARNYGHQLALSAGLSICTGERVLILDADLQDPPELLAEMMQRMDEGADVVYGQRVTRRGESLLKRASAAAFYRLFERLVDIKMPVDTGDFRLISRRACELLNDMPEHHRFIRGMVSWIGLTQVPLTYERQKRFVGKTKYPMKKMIRFAIDAITGFSVVPLKLASYLGILFGLLAVPLLVYTLSSWLLGATVRGWTSVMTVVLVLGSVQLVVLGVLGEYIGRLYMESKGRPLYIIDRLVRAPSDLHEQKKSASQPVVARGSSINEQ